MSKPTQIVRVRQAAGADRFALIDADGVVVSVLHAEVAEAQAIARRKNLTARKLNDREHCVQGWAVGKDGTIEPSAEYLALQAAMRDLP